MTLLDLLRKLNSEEVAELNDVIQAADIARMGGNKRWREVFKSAERRSKGALRKIYRSVYKEAVHGTSFFDAAHFNTEKSRLADAVSAAVRPNRS